MVLSEWLNEKNWISETILFLLWKSQYYMKWTNKGCFSLWHLCWLDRNKLVNALSLKTKLHRGLWLGDFSQHRYLTPCHWLLCACRRNPGECSSLCLSTCWWWMGIFPHSGIYQLTGRKDANSPCRINFATIIYISATSRLVGFFSLLTEL